MAGDDAARIGEHGHCNGSMSVKYLEWNNIWIIRGKRGVDIEIEVLILAGSEMEMRCSEAERIPKTLREVTQNNVPISKL
jgi:hypothetical protein